MYPGQIIDKYQKCVFFEAKFRYILDVKICLF